MRLWRWEGSPSSSSNTHRGVVTLSQTERNLPTIANVDARDFSDLACWLIVQIGPISLNVTTPPERSSASLEAAREINYSGAIGKRLLASRPERDAGMGT